MSHSLSVHHCLTIAGRHRPGGSLLQLFFSAPVSRLGVFSRTVGKPSANCLFQFLRFLKCSRLSQLVTVAAKRWIHRDTRKIEKLT